MLYRDTDEVEQGIDSSGILTSDESFGDSFLLASSSVFIRDREEHHPPPFMLNFIELIPSHECFATVDSFLTKNRSGSLDSVSVRSRCIFCQSTLYYYYVLLRIK